MNGRIEPMAMGVDGCVTTRETDYSFIKLIPKELGHNHSSSPGATLADRAERKVAKHGSRANPTIDPRHDSEPMHIML